MITFVLIAFLGYMNSSAQGIDAYLRAYKEIKLSAEHEGVVSLDSKESTRFEKGRTLFGINTESIELEIHIQELEKASFNKEIRLLEKRLKSKKIEVAVGTQGTEVALNLEEDLILKQHKEKLLNAKITQLEHLKKIAITTSPFQGIISKTLKQKHEYVRKGEVLAEIIDDSKLLASFQYPINQLSNIHKKEIFLEILGTKIQASLFSIKAKSDASTQWGSVKVIINNPHFTYKIGQKVQVWIK